MLCDDSNPDTAAAISRLVQRHSISRQLLLLAVRRMAGMLLPGMVDRDTWLRVFEAFDAEMQRSFIDDVVIVYTSSAFEVLDNHVG